MSQITVRLSADSRDRFDRYAKEVGLDASELARLLILRALRRPNSLRPPKRAGSNDAPKRVNRQRKLTAHFHRVEIVEEFDDYARAKGLHRATAAKIIFERELAERWLARALVWAPRRPRFAR